MTHRFAVRQLVYPSTLISHEDGPGPQGRLVDRRGRKARGARSPEGGSAKVGGGGVAKRPRPRLRRARRGPYRRTRTLHEAVAPMYSPEPPQTALKVVADVPSLTLTLNSPVPSELTCTGTVAKGVALEPR